MGRWARGRSARGVADLPGYERAVEVRRDAWGVVNRAWDTERERFVEVRLLRLVALDDETRDDLTGRLLDLEALPAHPHLGAVLATGLTDAGRGFVVASAEPGGSLSDAPAMPWRDAARLGAGLAGGLDAAHAAGVLHGAIRPECILLGALGGGRLADLGIAQMVRLVDVGAGGDVELSPEADVEALAAAIRGVIAGETPEALDAALGAGTAAGLAVALEEALAIPDPPAAAPAVGEEGDGEEAEAAAPAPPPPSPATEAPRPRRRLRVSRPLALGAAALITVVITLGVMILAPGLAGDMVRSSGPAPVDEAARTLSVDPSHWAPGSQWNLTGPALGPSGACGRAVGSFVYSFGSPKVPGSVYLVGAWLSSDVARLTPSPAAFSDVTLTVNGTPYPSRSVGAVSAGGQYIEWRVDSGGIRTSGNVIEYSVGLDSAHRNGLCIHTGSFGTTTGQRITVRSVD